MGDDHRARTQRGIRLSSLQFGGNEILRGEKGGGILEETGGIDSVIGGTSDDTENAAGVVESSTEYSSVKAVGYLERLTFLKRRLRLYLEAEEKILQAKSYTLDNRTITRENLSEIRKAISELLDEIAFLEGAKTGNVRRVVFVE